jgi:hypothetical protein
MGANWGDIARDISKAAPLLGNLLPGVGTIAGAAVGGVAAIVASALGVPADPDSIQAALANDPDAYVKLKTAEMENRTALAQISLSQFQAGIADLDSARKLAIAQPTDHTRQIITYIFMALVGLIVGGMFFVPAAQALLKDSVGSLAVGTVIGYIFNELKQVLAFWFGATSDTSSNQQQITAAALAPGTVTTGNPAPAAIVAVQSDSLATAPAAVASPSDTDDSGTQIYRGS